MTRLPKVYLCEDATSGGSVVLDVRVRYIGQAVDELYGQFITFSG
jgi:hypothetical protein